MIMFLKNIVVQKYCHNFLINFLLTLLNRSLTLFHSNKICLAHPKSYKPFDKSLHTNDKYNYSKVKSN